MDLFCGAGGAAMGFHRAGFDEIVGVDIRPQPNYPFEFHQADALNYPLDGFDLIHASPPCQFYTTLRSRHVQHGYPNLIPAMQQRLKGRAYVIENVEGAHRFLRSPIKLCGSSFHLGVRRHRLFECSFPIMAPPCAHGFQRPKFRVYEHGKWYLSPVAKVYGKGGGKANEHWAEAMGISWMTPEEIVESIPPAFTEYIGSTFLAQLEQAS